MIPITIRPITPSDHPHIQTIETQAGQIFHSVNMSAIANDSPPSIEGLEASQGWIAVLSPPHPNEKNDDDERVGYIHIELFENEDKTSIDHNPVDSKGSKTVFIEQVSVLPTYAHQGIGKALVSHVENWAREMGCGGVDLTTFRDVPWNRAYYERLGFRVVDEEELQEKGFDGLKRVVEMERGHELLGRWERVGMRKVLA